MNKQKDRLVELLTNSEIAYAQYLSEACDKAIKGDVTAQLMKRLEFYADYILADGWMRPPCKIGQTVYKVVNDKRVKKPYECKVVGIWYADDENANDVHLVRYVNGIFDCSFSVQFKEFGKTVFLTKEEAEKALGGVQG